MAAARCNEAQESGIRSRFADEVGFLWERKSGCMRARRLFT